MLLSGVSAHAAGATAQLVTSATCVFSEEVSGLLRKGLWAGGLVKWLKRIQALSTPRCRATEPARELMRTRRRQPISRWAGGTAKLTILGAKKRETRSSPGFKVAIAADGGGALGAP